MEGQAAAAMVEAERDGRSWWHRWLRRERWRDHALLAGATPQELAISLRILKVVLAPPFAYGRRGGRGAREAAEGTTVRLDPEAADKAVAARAVAVLEAAALGAAARVAEEQVVVAQAAAARRTRRWWGEALGEAGLVVEEWEEAEAAVEGTAMADAVGGGGAEVAVEEVAMAGEAKEREARGVVTLEAEGRVEGSLAAGGWHWRGRST